MDTPKLTPLPAALGALRQCARLLHRRLCRRRQLKPAASLSKSVNRWVSKLKEQHGQIFPTVPQYESKADIDRCLDAVNAVLEELQRVCPRRKRRLRRSILEKLFADLDSGVKTWRDAARRVDKESYADRRRIYNAYILSPEWRAIRARILGLRGAVCEKCGSCLSLHVHHLTYVRLGAEEDADLMVLCKSCHQLEHKRKLN